MGSLPVRRFLVPYRCAVSSCPDVLGMPLKWLTYWFALSPIHRVHHQVHLPEVVLPFENTENFSKDLARPTLSMVIHMIHHLREILALPFVV